MNIRRRLVLLAIATVLLAAIAGGIIRMSQKRELPREFVLPDGNRVTLVDVMVGTNSSINFGTPVERVLAHLPGKLGKKFSANVVEESALFDGGTTLTFWFSYERMPLNGFSICSAVTDRENSLRSPGFWSWPRVLPNGKIITYSGTPYWPRREKTLRVRLTAMLTNNAEYHDLGEITVSNPDYREYPQWPPEALPATRQFEDVSFTLERVKEWDVRIRVKAGEKPEVAWTAWNYEMRDATGNRVSGYSYSPRTTPIRADMFGVVRLPINVPSGMPREKAWKLGIQFVSVGKIASNDVFVVRGVPATAGRRGWWTTNLPCGTVRFQQQPDWVNGRINTWCLSLIEPGAINYERPLRNPACFAILGAVNDHGEKAKMLDGKRVEIPSGSTTLDVTIGVVRQRIVEYIIDPEMLVNEPPLP